MRWEFQGLCAGENCCSSSESKMRRVDVVRSDGDHIAGSTCEGERMHRENVHYANLSRRHLWQTLTNDLDHFIEYRVVCQYTYR